MILEEFIGSFVSLVSSFVLGIPPISQENPRSQRDSTLIIQETEENCESQEVDNGLIHQEYEVQLPQHEENIPILVEASEENRRSFCESLCRSFMTNLGILVAVVFIIGLLTIGVVYIDLNTKNVCIAWIRNNQKVTQRILNLQRAASCISNLAFVLWFPGIVVMLWGFQQFKKHYLTFLSGICIVTLSFTCIFNSLLYKKLVKSKDNIYMIPNDIVFLSAIVISVYLVSRKFKRVNPEIHCSVLRISFVLLFPCVGACLFSYLMVFVVIKKFGETEGRTKKAVIAALTPGIAIPLTAVSKYLVLRKSWEFIPSDRAFVLCFFIRGGAIAVYRTLQSGFQDIWIFISLSLLHGVSNVLSKATLRIRVKIWKCIVKCFNRSRCGPILQVRCLNSPRIRRFNADLEIQNILFEYIIVVISQTYLTFYILMNYDIPRWQIVRGSMIKLGLSFGIDLAFNIISVFVQVHYYDIPMRSVWRKCWRLHVIANLLIIFIYISYFAPALVSVFAGNDFFKDLKIKNCTTIF